MRDDGLMSWRPGELAVHALYDAFHEGRITDYESIGAWCAESAMDLADSRQSGGLLGALAALGGGGPRKELAAIACKCMLRGDHHDAVKYYLELVCDSAALDGHRCAFGGVLRNRGAARAAYDAANGEIMRMIRDIEHMGSDK
jgi:hypothetical protein